MQQGDSTSGQKKSDFCFQLESQCLKITEKVSFNIASESSYVYILSGQKLNRNAQNGEKCQNWKIQMRRFE